MLMGEDPYLVGEQLKNSLVMDALGEVIGAAVEGKITKESQDVDWIKVVKSGWNGLVSTVGWTIGKIRQGLEQLRAKRKENRKKQDEPTPQAERAPPSDQVSDPAQEEQQTTPVFCDPTTGCVPDPKNIEDIRAILKRQLKPLPEEGMTEPNGWQKKDINDRVLKQSARQNKQVDEYNAANKRLAKLQQEYNTLIEKILAPANKSGVRQEMLTILKLLDTIKDQMRRAKQTLAENREAYQIDQQLQQMCVVFSGVNGAINQGYQPRAKYQSPDNIIDAALETATKGGLFTPKGRLAFMNKIFGTQNSEGAVDNPNGRQFRVVRFDFARDADNKINEDDFKYIVEALGGVGVVRFSQDDFWDNSKFPHNREHAIEFTPVFGYGDPFNSTREYSDDVGDIGRLRPGKKEAFRQSNLEFGEYVTVEIFY